MAHNYKNNPVISEMDEIAHDLEKTGNADLARMVDEAAAELMTAKPRKVATRKKTRKAKPTRKRARKNRKSASSKKRRSAKTNFSSQRARIARAMKKIASAQVVELEDIAAELLTAGDKTAALAVLKIADDLDSDYDYSQSGSHDSCESKGDASKRYERAKDNKPDAKMDAEEKEDLEYPHGDAEGKGYPLNEKKSSYDQSMEDILRVAMEGLDEDEAGDELALDEEGGDDDFSDLDEEGGDDDFSDLDEEGGEEELDFGDEEGGEEDLDFGGDEGEDELAAYMEGMGDDMDAGLDRMAGEDEDLDFGDEELDFGDEEGGDEGFEDEGFGEEEEGFEEEEDEFGGLDEDAEDMDDPALDDAGDEEASLMSVDTPLGGVSLGSSEKKRMKTLAKKLQARGEDKLARRVAKLVKNSK